MTRIQRQLCYVLLNIRTEEITNAWENNYLRILGFTANGQKYLNQIKKNVTWPILARVGKSGAKQVPLTLRSDEVYRLASKEIKEQNFGQMPLIVN